MTQVTDNQLARYFRFMADISARILKGSLDPEQIMNVIRPLIGQKKKVLPKGILIQQTLYLELVSADLRGDVPAFLYKMKDRKNGFFRDIYRSFNVDEISNLAFPSWNQAEEFAQSHPAWFTENNEENKTFILYTDREKNLYVGNFWVYKNGGFGQVGYRPTLDEEFDDFIWKGRDNHRFVISAIGLLDNLNKESH